MPTYTSFEQLDCWKKCQAVRLWTMRVSAKFPSYEKFDLVDNMKRAARSSTRNIAEGFGRHHHKENIQFCRISRGSLTELIDDLLIASEEQYISKSEYATGRAMIEQAIFSINGYIKYLKSRL